MRHYAPFLTMALGLAVPGMGPGKPDATRLPVRVVVVNFDPVLKSSGVRLHQACGWNDPRELAARYAADVRQASHGIVTYTIAKWIDADEFPVKLDGFCYTEDSYQACRQGRSKWHEPDAVDYTALIARHKLVALIDRGDADEVWLFGPPYAGFCESCMAGPGAFWINGDPVPKIASKRAFVLMGFNYERGPGEMLEDLGHRTEATMSRVYGGWEAGQDRNDWERFTLYDQVAPGRSGCGSVHWAPNSAGDYDWGNKREVLSTCDNWLTYPDGKKGKPRRVDAAEWGGGDMRAHHLWWLAHLPHAEGRTEGKANNWWLYVIDFNRTILGGPPAGSREGRP